MAVSLTNNDSVLLMKAGVFPTNPTDLDKFVCVTYSKKDQSLYLNC